MNDVITFEMILELPRMLLDQAEKYHEYSETLNKNKCSQYNCKELRDNIDQKINHYKEIKYFCKFPAEISSIKSPVYSLSNNSYSKTIKDPVSQMVDKQIDDQIWLSEFYHAMFVVASKWTMQEAIYFVDAFFANKSEEIIAEKLSICKNTLLNVKKSSLIKVWLELENLN